MILRVFINSYDLTREVDWVFIANSQQQEHGSSTLKELATFEDVSLEVYLSADLAGIYKINTSGIKNRKLTEELVLGLIEDDLVDDVADVKAIILTIEDDITYIAVINNEFYKALMQQLHSLGKNIIFVQSFVYATRYQENTWTVHIVGNQRFVRISKFQYVVLDGTEASSIVLTRLLLGPDAPKTMYLYVDKKYDIEFPNGTKVIEVNEYDFEFMTWNFHNPKSTLFHTKFDAVTKAALRKLFTSIKYFILCVSISWVIYMIVLTLECNYTDSQIKNNIKTIINTDTVSVDTFQRAREVILQVQHENGLYNNGDAMPLLQDLLETASSITSDDITGIYYKSSTLTIFLAKSFDQSNFLNYQHILSTKYIKSDIMNYKEFKKNYNASSDQTDKPNLDSSTDYVITMRYI